MVRYPISVKGDAYRGNNPTRQRRASKANREAQLIEDAFNELLLKQTEPIQVYGWEEVTSTTGLSYETVRKFGFSIDCGSGGFTAIRCDLTYGEALAERDSGQVPVDAKPS